MNDENVLRIREPRCSACKLTPEVLAALHDDRFESMLPFEELAAKYGLSDSAIRRHMRRHAAERDDSPIPEVEDIPEEGSTTPGAYPGDGFNGEAILATGT